MEQTAELKGSDSGHTYVFTKTANGWKQTAELKGSDTEAGRRVRQRWRPSRAPSPLSERPTMPSAPAGRTCSEPEVSALG